MRWGFEYDRKLMRTDVVDRSPVWTGKIDVKAKREACELFDVKGLVRIEPTKRLPRAKRVRGYRRYTLAQHSWQDGMHVIEVAATASRKAADALILHELAHAGQLERYGGPSSEAERRFRRAYDAESRRVGYDANRFEVEANEAAALCDEIRVTR
jgi:hypothetical protein